MNQQQDIIDSIHALDRLRDEVLDARAEGRPFDKETETLIAAVRAYRKPYANPKDFKVKMIRPRAPLKVGHVLTKRGPGRRKALDTLAENIEKGGVLILESQRQRE